MDLSWSLSAALAFTAVVFCRGILAGGSRLTIFEFSKTVIILDFLGFFGNVQPKAMYRLICQFCEF